MSSVILGIGTGCPVNRITQEQAFQAAQQYCGGSERQKRALKHLYSRATIENRGVVLSALSAEERIAASDMALGEFFPLPLSEGDLGPSTSIRMNRYEAEIPSLAIDACRRAIADANENVTARANSRMIAPLDFTSLITVSCTGFSSPGLDIQIIERLGLSRSIARTHVGFMGCHGAMNGLRVADAMSAKTGPVLLCAAEICSIHFHYGWNSDNLLANSLFADGAAALVLDQSTDDSKAVSDNWCLRSSASYVVPGCADAMSWKIKDDGFAMTLSPNVPDLIRANLKDWLQSWLQSLGLQLNDIQGWAVHPGGIKILEAVQQSLELKQDDLNYSFAVLQEFGNMSSPTVFFILDKIRASVGCVPTVVLAFGPGLTIEAAFIN